jgi:hypothetical protein
MAMMKKTTTTTMSGDPMKRAINKASRIEKRGATPTGGVSLKAQSKAQSVIEKAGVKVKNKAANTINRISKIEKRGATPTGGVSLKAQAKAANVYERAVKKGKIAR